MSVLKVDNVYIGSNVMTTDILIHNTKLWCAFDASTGTPVISNSYSISTISDLAVGQFIVKPDVFTAANTATMLIGHTLYARDNNATAANTGYCGVVGGNAQIRVGLYHPTLAFVDPRAVSVIGAYERIIK